LLFLTASAAAEPRFTQMVEAAAADSPILSIEPETFVFASGVDYQSYVRGFAAAAERILQDLGGKESTTGLRAPAPHEQEAAVMATTGPRSDKGSVEPVQRYAPGNSPTIMSVAALDANLEVAFFSSGGKVEIAGPGVDVFSSWPLPQRYKTESGTSMATPHAAGAAALWAQSNPALQGQSQWDALVGNTRPLPSPVTDVGAGLMQCP
jgi:subtilisin family serine protease